MPKCELLAIGNPVYDIIITPYAKTNGRVLSGCSTNAALAFAKLGGKACAVGKIGEDYREDFIKVLSKYGATAIPLPSKETGGFYLRYIDERMNDRELKVLGVADKIGFEEIPSDLLDSPAILLGPILKELDAVFVEKLREAAKDSFIITDPQGFIRKLSDDGKVIRYKEESAFRVFELSDVVKPNEHEAEVLFPGMSPPEIAEKLRKISGRYGIVTVAERGSYIATESGVYHIPAFRTKEVDPTGCGDVYGGAFAYYFLKHEDPIEAAAFASATASFMVEQIGPHFEIPEKELQRRFEVILNGVKKI